MNLSGISSYEQNIQNVKAAESDVPVDAAKAQNASALGGVSAGQIVTGEVAQVKGKTVTINLPNNQVVTARLEADVALSAGQSVAFAVKSNSGTQIALTPLFSNAAVNPAAIKALGQASILVNEMTLSMASTMMDEGMSVDRNSLQAMMRIVGQYPDADPKDIVAMVKQGLPINDETLSQFAAYRNNEHQLMNLTSELSGEVGDVLSELSMEAKSELVSVFNGESSKWLTDSIKTGLEDVAMRLMAGEEQAEEVEGKEAQAGTDTVGAKEADLSLSASSNASEAEVVIEDAPLKQVLDDGMRKQLADGLKELGVSEDMLSQIKDGVMQPQKAMTLVQAAIDAVNGEFSQNQNIPENVRESINNVAKELSNSPAFKALLKNTIENAFSLKASDGVDNEKIQKLYERMVKDTQKVHEILENAGKGDSPAAKSIDNIRQNVSFMNQLNEAFTYVQLPIKMAGENAHGDLYVYTNKKKLAEKDGNVTALLHLEMETLGVMDIHVALSDGNKVKTHFNLEKEEMLDFIADNLHILDERLEKRGYSMKSEVTLKNKEEDKNPAVSAMLGSNKQKVSAVRYSFDVRA